mmetsp:Transcript_42480/g.104636  ORF Transcript_42480/g.104636 Transcript_42480/m.104636 type:complete len:215 (-) Transcript_42480:93-737(-)
MYKSHYLTYETSAADMCSLDRAGRCGCRPGSSVSVGPACAARCWRAAPRPARWLVLARWWAREMAPGRSLLTGSPRQHAAVPPSTARPPACVQRPNHTRLHLWAQLAARLTSATRGCPPAMHAMPRPAPARERRPLPTPPPPLTSCPTRAGRWASSRTPCSRPPRCRRSTTCPCAPSWPPPAWRAVPRARERWRGCAGRAASPRARGPAAPARR